MCFRLNQIHSLHTKIQEMHQRMDHTINKNHHPRQLMQINMLVQGQIRTVAPRPQKRDTLPQHEHQDEHAVEIQALP